MSSYPDGSEFRYCARHQDQTSAQERSHAMELAWVELERQRQEAERAAAAEEARRASEERREKRRQDAEAHYREWSREWKSRLFVRALRAIEVHEAMSQLPEESAVGDLDAVAALSVAEVLEGAYPDRGHRAVAWVCLLADRRLLVDGQPLMLVEVRQALESEAQHWSEVEPSGSGPAAGRSGRWPRWSHIDWPKVVALGSVGVLIAWFVVRTVGAAAGLGGVALLVAALGWLVWDWFRVPGGHDDESDAARALHNAVQSQLRNFDDGYRWATEHIEGCRAHPGCADWRAGRTVEYANVSPLVSDEDPVAQGLSDLAAAARYADEPALGPGLGLGPYSGYDHAIEGRDESDRPPDASAGGITEVYRLEALAEHPGASPRYLNAYVQARHDGLPPDLARRAARQAP